MNHIPFRPAVIERTPALVASMTQNVEALALGLKTFKFIGRKGDLSVILTHVKPAGRTREEPCLVLANARNPQERHVFVPLSQLWQVLEPDFMAAAAPKLAAVLYGHVTRDDCYRITDALYDYAEDLQKAKPAPKMTSRQWLQALAEDGWTIHHQGHAVNG